MNALTGLLGSVDKDYSGTDHLRALQAWEGEHAVSVSQDTPGGGKKTAKTVVYRRKRSSHLINQYLVHERTVKPDWIATV